MFYFYSHRGPQWNRMSKAGHGLLCGHRGLKQLWNARHGLLCGHRGLKMEQDLKFNDLLCGHRGSKMEREVKCRPWITLWPSRSQTTVQCWPWFASWPSRSQDGTGPEILATIYFVGIEVPRWNETWNASHGLFFGHRGLNMERDVKCWTCFPFVDIEVPRWNGTWNASHGLLCSHRGAEKEWDVKCRSCLPLCGRRELRCKSEGVEEVKEGGLWGLHNLLLIFVAYWRLNVVACGSACGFLSVYRSLLIFQTKS